MRQKSVQKKFGVLSHNVIGKRIVLVDDSIVRGNTMGIIVRLLREYGAKEVTGLLFMNGLHHSRKMI